MDNKSNSSFASENGNAFYEATPSALATSNNISYLLRLSTASIHHMINNKVSHLGLTAMQWRPLVIIKYVGLNTAADIARRESTDTGSMTRAIDRLEAKGFLTRERCEEDRRVQRLHLTDKGNEVCEKILPAVASTLNNHLNGFSQDETQLLISLLKRLIENGTKN